MGSLCPICFGTLKDEECVACLDIYGATNNDTTSAKVTSQSAETAQSKGAANSNKVGESATEKVDLNVPSTDSNSQKAWNGINKTLKLSEEGKKLQYVEVDDGKWMMALLF